MLQSQVFCKIHKNKYTGSFNTIVGHGNNDFVIFFSGQVVMGGNTGTYQVDNYFLTSVELFPPSSHSCSIPDLPQPRSHHSLSLLSGGRLVVCGGTDDEAYDFDSCISWVAGNTIWTPFHTMRCLPIITHLLKNTITVWRELVTRPGRRPLFPTPLSCSAAGAVQQSSLQRL